MLVWCGPEKVKRGFLELYHVGVLLPPMENPGSGVGAQSHTLARSYPRICFASSYNQTRIKYYLLVGGKRDKHNGMNTEHFNQQRAVLYYVDIRNTLSYLFKNNNTKIKQCSIQ